MRISIVITVLFACLNEIALSQTLIKVSGSVENEDQKPIEDVLVKNKSKNKWFKKRIWTQTGSDGKFEIIADPDDELKFKHNEYLSSKVTVKDSDFAFGNGIVQQLQKGDVNSNHYWVGAQLSVDVTDRASDDIFGSSKVIINEVDRFIKDDRFSLRLVGNISKLTSSFESEPGNNADQDEVEKGINDIAQSQQGLIVGLSPMFKTNYDRIYKKDALRIYSVIGYKLNTIDNEMDEESSEDFSQFRLTGGIELEFLEAAGAPFVIGFEGGITAFSKKRYEDLFGEEKGSLSFWESFLIVPIRQGFGLLFMFNKSEETEVVPQIGLVFRSL